MPWRPYARQGMLGGLRNFGNTPTAALGVIWVEEDSCFASARSGFPRTHGDVLAVFKGQSRPRQATKYRLWLIVCCRSWCARVLQANVRGDADGPSFPTARRDSLSSPSDHFH